MIRIAFFTNAGPNTGVGHRVYQIKKRLAEHKEVRLVDFHLDGTRGLLSKHSRPTSWIRPWPGLLGSKSVNWIRLGRKLHQYIDARSSAPRTAPQTSGAGGGAKDHFDLFHATNQTLSFLMRRRHPSIVTVHDLIEVLQPQSNPVGILSKYLYSGISKADLVIAVSHYTAKTVQDYYGIPADRITVIPNGVGPEFHPIGHFEQTIGYQTLRQELRLQPEDKVILYVGSEHPRKNLLIALEAYAQAKRMLPNLIFVKVGEPGLAAGRVQFLEAVDRFKARDTVRILGDVSPERLNELYNLADVFIFPSRFEGFGLPPLQAMAAGTPVICSNATSLPEVAGNAAVMHNPDDIDGFAQSIVHILHDQAFADQFRQRGLERAKQFSWEEAAAKEASVYESLVV